LESQYGLARSPFQPQSLAHFGNRDRRQNPWPLPSKTETEENKSRPTAVVAAADTAPFAEPAAQATDRI
jgi:hypothetical protein